MLIDKPGGSWIFAPKCKGSRCGRNSTDKIVVVDVTDVESKVSQIMQWTAKGRLAQIRQTSHLRHFGRKSAREEIKLNVAEEEEEDKR